MLVLFPFELIVEGAPMIVAAFLSGLSLVSDWKPGSDDSLSNWMVPVLYKNNTHTMLDQN